MKKFEDTPLEEDRPEISSVKEVSAINHRISIANRNFRSQSLIIF